MQWSSADVLRIGDHGSVVLHEVPGCGGYEGGDEKNDRHGQGSETERLGNTLDRKGRVRFDAAVAHFAHLLGTAHEFIRTGELGEQAIDLGVVAHAPCSLVSPGFLWTSPRISLMATMGKMRMKTKNNVRKSPKLPKRVIQSHFVP